MVGETHVPHGAGAAASRKLPWKPERVSSGAWIQPEPWQGHGPDQVGKRSEKTGKDKTSIVCFLKEDKPGSLFTILKEFAARNINLTRLESRPAKKNLGDYVFLIDIDGHLHDREIFEALEVLRKTVYLVKILGSYPRWN